MGGIAAGGGTSFAYVYDMSDDWEHAIAIERAEPIEPGLRGRGEDEQVAILAGSIDFRLFDVEARVGSDLYWRSGSAPRNVAPAPFPGLPYFYLI